jgi:NAD(P)-dependent dehydrogenase (short-subunit alcohol dehydrogenase family)
MSFGTPIQPLGRIGIKKTIVKNFLLFGATGSIGFQCEKDLSAFGEVVRASKDQQVLEKQLAGGGHFDAVIWAQGLNATDSIINFESRVLEELLQANLGYILETAQLLISKGKVAAGSNFVIVSSIWSQLSRPEKLTYSISKAATAAAVRSMAVDLGQMGIQVNAIAPGPIDSPMTKRNLSDEQIELIASQTPLKRLVTLEEVANVVTRFATGELSGITGQEIIVDGGWSVSKLV